MSFLIFVGAFALAIVFLVETLSWFLRANAVATSRAYVISKSNLLLYSSRIFFFAFQFIISYYIEAVKSGRGIVLLFIIGLGGTAAIHILVFYVKSAREICWQWIVTILRTLNRWSPETMSPELPTILRPQANQLMLATSVSSIIFALAITLPYLLALSNPDYRLTITSFIQLLNFVGTLFLLYFVDPIMYRLMDSERLRDSIYHYIAGRIIGFSAAAIMGSLTIFFV